MVMRPNLIIDLPSLGLAISILTSILVAIAFLINIHYLVRRNIESIAAAKKRISENQKNISRIEKYLISNTDYAKKTNETYEDY